MARFATTGSAAETVDEAPPAPRLQRVAACGELTVRRVAGRTRIARMYQEGAAKIRIPETEGDPLQAVLINTAGGLTGGDRLAWAVRIEEQAALSLTTQACEKLYRAPDGHAGIDCAIRVADGGRLAWLPQETIAYDGSAMRRRLDVELHGGASALILEATIFGRSASGEIVRRALFRDSWRIRVDGRLVHAEEMAIDGDAAALLARHAVAAGCTAFATLVMIDPDCERHLDAARTVLGDAGGASHWRAAGTGKLLARLAAPDGMALRARLVPLIELLNGQAGLPRIWTS